MDSRRFLQLTSAIFLALGVFLAIEGWSLGIAGMYGPGPGMFAVVIGVGLILTNAIWLTQLTFAALRLELPELTGNRAGLIRIAGVIAVLLAFGFLLRPLGFNLAMLLLLLALLLGFRWEYVATKVVLAFLFSFGTHYVFETMLRVPLPYASIPVLRGLGL